MATWNVLESTKEEIDWVENQIDQFNRHQISFTGKSEIFLNYTIKDKDTIIAGINSCFYFEEILCIGTIFVEEAYRNQGLGSILLNKVENVARTKGAKLAHLHTFDFNEAKDFYLKHGYEIFGILDDCPTGYSHYYLKKKL